MQCCKITYFVGKFSHGVSIFAELFNTCCKARYTAIITPPLTGNYINRCIGCGAGAIAGLRR